MFTREEPSPGSRVSVFAQRYTGRTAGHMGLEKQHVLHSPPSAQRPIESSSNTTQTH